MKIAKPERQSRAQYNDNIGMSIDTNTLTIFCRYIISDSSFIRMNHVVTLNNFINSLDIRLYESDPEKMNRIKFINKGIEARLNYNLTDIQLILNHILSGLNFNPDFIDENNLGLTSDEIQWTHEMIEQSSKYGFAYTHADDFLDICTRLKTSDYAHRGGIINEFEDLINVTKNKFRQVATDDNITDIEFSLDDSDFESSISDIHKIITNPSRKLQCGMQGLNQMLGGGFESGRVYIFLGITAVGKSATLLNLIHQIKKHNTDFEPKDKTKTPCIAYLTMENTVVETVTRLFDIATESQYGMENYSLQEVISKLKTEGQLELTNRSPIDIYIKYKANRSVDTSYLYQLYDDLADKGKEVICLVQDHLMRIRSIFANKEPRFELGDIVNEFKSFAAEKDIPVISNFHLNRDAMRVVEDYQKKATHIDITQKLGKSNVSESVMILNNTDCGIIINRDADEAGVQYMGFNLAKTRIKTNFMYFAQPFMYGSGIRLVEDINGPAMYKTSIHGNSNISRMDGVRVSSANVMNNIGQAMKDESSDNTFNKSKGTYLPLDDTYKPEPKKDDLIIPKIIDPLYPVEVPKDNKLDLSGLEELKNTLNSRKQTEAIDAFVPVEQ